MKNPNTKLIVFLITFLMLTDVYGQINSPAADYTQPTAYTNGMPEDEIFVYCSPDVNGNAVTGSLSATPTIAGPGYTFEWGSYDENTHTYTVFHTDNGVPTSTISNLQTGGYNVTITNNAGETETFITWLYVSIVDVQIDLALDPVNPGCEPFDVNGTIAASGFTYWDPVDPGAAPFVVDANTEITVCFDANHTYVSDLGFVLIGPAGCGNPGVTLSPNPQVINNGNGCCCNSGNNLNNLCFSTANANQLNMCGSGTPLSGTYGWYNGNFPGTGGNNYPQGGLAGLYGCNAAEGGWAVQIYDCIGADVGALTGASIVFDNGTSQIVYDSGAINSAINDNSCDPNSASIYVVPLTTPINPDPNQVPNSGTLTYTLGLNGAPVTLTQGTNSFTENIDPIPNIDEWYYLEIEDELGCAAIDSVMFDFTGYADATIDDPIPNVPTNTFCVNDPAEQLTSVNPGGTWTGPGVSPAGLFDPNTAGVGNHAITYEIPDPCGDSDIINITVYDIPDASINPVNPLNELCADEPAVQLTTVNAGGDFSGNGVSITGLFDPALAGVGTHTITYNIGGNCPASSTMDITVLHVNDATITPLNATNKVCIYTAPVQLTSVDPGGAWSGPGVSATGVFTPATAGVGVHTITCNIPDPCGDIKTMDVEVIEVTFTNAPTDPLCFNEPTGSINIANETGDAPHLFSIDGGTNTQATGQFPDIFSGNYNLVVEDVNGCVSQPVAVTLNQPTELVVSAAMDQQSNCEQPDGQATADAQGGTIGPGYLYQWNSIPGQNTATAIGLLPQGYTVVATDDHGCTDTTTVLITSTPQISVDIISITDPLCKGSCDGSATAVPGPNAVTGVGETWSWNSATPNNAATATDLCGAVWYTVTYTDAVGCVATADTVLTEPTDVIVDVIIDTNLICIGGTDSLWASASGGSVGGYSYTWDAAPSDLTLVINDQNQVVGPVNTTSYTVFATDANGCNSASVTFDVNVNPTLQLDVIRPTTVDSNICPYDSAMIDLLPSGGNGNYTIYQLPNMANPVTFPMKVQPSNDSTFTFLLTDDCETPDVQVSVAINLKEMPQIDYSVSDSVGCQPFEVEFQDLTQPIPAFVYWDFGDEDLDVGQPEGPTASYTYPDAGSYDVSVRVITAEGCTDSITDPQRITVNPLPEAHFIADPSFVNLFDARIQFNDRSTDEIIAWNWSFGDGDNSTVQDPVHIYPDTGIFTVILQVENNFNCLDSAHSTVEIHPDYTMYIPSSFTPNNDGHNEVFKPLGDGFYQQTYSFKIFNRWGELIFETGNYDLGWDGTHKGAQVEVGVFTYQVKVVDLNNFNREHYGHVTLIR